MSKRKWQLACTVSLQMGPMDNLGNEAEYKGGVQDAGFFLFCNVQPPLSRQENLAPRFFLQLSWTHSIPLLKKECSTPRYNPGFKSLWWETFKSPWRETRDRQWGGGINLTFMNYFLSQKEKVSDLKKKNTLPFCDCVRAFVLVLPHCVTHKACQSQLSALISPLSSSEIQAHEAGCSVLNPPCFLSSLSFFSFFF